ncbi:MAG: AI-2E family transporter [Bacteroidales bacterium]|nr:AI-2E family transporter [Bacteroidales bacterium]
MEQNKQSNVEKLAGFVLWASFLAVVGLLCWYFRNVLIYIVLAIVVSLLSRPLARFLGKVRIKNRYVPDWLSSLLSILCVLGGFILIVTQVIPVVTGIVREASFFSNLRLFDGTIADTVNGWAISIFPSLGKDFDAISVLLDYLKGTFSDISITGILGSMASVMVNLAIGLFSVVFISFFLVKDPKLVAKVAAALVPDRIEDSVMEAIGDIEHLLSRYFVGLTLEMIAVAFFNFLGLWLIARIGPTYALGIAFIAGILNILPYVGPLIGEVLGVALCLVLKYGAGIGLDVNIMVFAVIVFAIMLSVQFIDNFVLQPIIYSTSIQSTPLEIFIVLLISGHVGGILGMLAAIPIYTVIRVVAGRFFYNHKAVRRLMPDLEKDVHEMNESIS